MDVVIGQRTPVLQLLAGEDQTLLVRRDTFLILDFGLDIIDGIGGFDFEGDGFTREGLYEAGGWFRSLWAEGMFLVGMEKGLTSALWVR